MVATVLGRSAGLARSWATVAERWVTPTVRFAWKLGRKTVISGRALYTRLAANRIDAILASTYEPGQYEDGYCTIPSGSGRCHCRARGDTSHCTEHNEDRKAVVVARLAALYLVADARHPLHEAAPFDLSHFTEDQLDQLQVAIDWHRAAGRHKPAKRTRRRKAA
jgi:hypothetical protein